MPVICFNHHLKLQDQVSSLIRDVRSSRIFDSNFEAGRSFDSDFLPSTGMQKSCTASSIADLGESSQPQKQNILQKISYLINVV